VAATGGRRRNRDHAEDPTRARVSNGLRTRQRSPNRIETNWRPTQKVMRTPIGAMFAAGKTLPNRPAVTITT